MTISPRFYNGRCFPTEIIEHAVWLYQCFSHSLQGVETILAARGVVVSYAGSRDWGLRFGRLCSFIVRIQTQQTDRETAAMASRELGDADA